MISKLISKLISQDPIRDIKPKWNDKRCQDPR